MLARILSARINLESACGTCKPSQPRICRACSRVRPGDLVQIVLTGNTSRGKQRPGRGCPADAESWRAASRPTRKREENRSEADKLLGEARALLNKVTEDTFRQVIDDIRTQTSLFQYVAEHPEGSEAGFQLNLAKLFVGKAKYDHGFLHLYAQIAADFATSIPNFARRIVQAATEALPRTQFEPDDKRGYLGMLLFLVELCKAGQLSTDDIRGIVDGILATVEQCNPNVILSVQREHETVGDGASNAQTVEVCIELLCNFLPQMFQVARPSWTRKSLAQLRQLQAEKTIKPRCRFMLMDFFKQIK